MLLYCVLRELLRVEYRTLAEFYLILAPVKLATVTAPGSAPSVTCTTIRFPRKHASFFSLVQNWTSARMPSRAFRPDPPLSFFGVANPPSGIVEEAHAVVGQANPRGA